MDNADGDDNFATGGDDPWDFGTCIEYPALRTDFNGDQRPEQVRSMVPLAVPARPTGLVGVPGRNRITHHWEHLCDRSVTSYQYRQSTDNGYTWSQDWTAIPNSDAETTSYRPSGLSFDATYTFQIRAVNGAGNGPASESVTVYLPSLRVYLERLDGGRYYPGWESWRPLPAEVNTREHTWDALAPHIYNVSDADVYLQSASLTLITGTGMADASDFSNLGAGYSFDWFTLPISGNLPIQPLPEGVVPTVEESPSGPENGRWIHPYWGVADDRTLEGDEQLQVRLDYTLTDGTVGTYTTEPITIDDDDAATVSVRDATAEEGDGTVSVQVRLTVSDDPTAGPGLGASGGDGPGNSPQKLLFPISVDYVTGDDAAVAGSDYTSASGTLTFDGADLTRSVSIGLLGDDILEEDETFTVTISNLVKGTTIREFLDTSVAIDYDVGTVTLTEETLVETSPSVNITAIGNPLPGNRVTMTAHINNPQEGSPGYRWQRRLSSGWRDTPQTGDTKSVRFDTNGTRTYRAIIRYPGGRDIVSEPFSLTWGDPRG